MIIFYRFLSFIFIFEHFLSFSLSLLGAQNLIFLGPLFRYDFCRQFLCEKSIFGRISGGNGNPFWTLFSFFPYFFLTVFFFFFFLAFYFSFFLIFCSFLHVLIFLMFFTFFFHFSEEKVSSFLLSKISFKYDLLLALVSEFNRFLRSRCSMEMWCPDDIGGIAGIGLGRLLGREHASTPQSGVEAC